MAESITSLAALRRHIASLDRTPAGQDMPRVSTGHGGIDAALSGGLARGRLHELFGAADEDGAAAGLTLLFARIAGAGMPLLWLRTAAAARIGGHAYGPGLAALGIDPAHLLIGQMADEAMLLRAAVDALRCPALGALLVELRGRAPLLDLTASRRLALAAEASGVTAFILRIGADPVPSAADTRWQVAAAPSTPLPGNAPGMTAFAIHLLRQRAGPDGQDWRLRWDSEKKGFEDARDERHDDRERRDHGRHAAPLPRPVVSVPSSRPAPDRAA